MGLRTRRPGEESAPETETETETEAEAARLRAELAALEGRNDSSAEALRAVYRQRLRYLADSAARRRLVAGAPLSRYLRARQGRPESESGDET